MKQHDDDLGIAWRRVQDRIISSPLQWITMSGETRKRRNREWSQGEPRVTCRPSRVMCQHCDSGDEVSETSTDPPPSRNEGSEVADDEVLEERLRRLIHRPIVQASSGGVLASLDEAAHVLEAPD